MAARERSHRISARGRVGEAVTPLELFFDLVFVLGFTQCSLLMQSGHGWRPVGQGLLVLAVLWWAWCGYSWLTSVVDPDDGLSRLVVFVAMGAMLVAALCVPQVFHDRALGLTFAGAYAVVRGAHIGLFVIASEDDRQLRRSVLGLSGSTVVGVALLAVAALCDGWLQAALWLVALAVDMIGPMLFGAAGWRLVPGHFAERYGLVVLIALGESIVALGVGTEVGLTAGVISTAVLGFVTAAAMWWSYFDVGSVFVARRLIECPPGREQNEMARDGYSLLHFPIVAGIVLVALGLEHALNHVHDPLDDVGAVALAGGVALFLLGQVAFKARVVGNVSWQRVVAALVLLAAIPALQVVDAWAAVALTGVAMWALVGYEVVRYREARAEVRAWEAER